MPDEVIPVQLRALYLIFAVEETDWLRRRELRV